MPRESTQGHKRKVKTMARNPFENPVSLTAARKAYAMSLFDMCYARVARDLDNDTTTEGVAIPALAQIVAAYTPHAGKGHAEDTRLWVADQVAALRTPDAAQEAQAQEAQAQEAQAQEAQAQEAPAQEAPAQEAPAQEAPAQEKNRHRRRSSPVVKPPDCFLSCPCLGATYLSNRRGRTMFTLTELDVIIDALQKAVLDAEAMRSAKKAGDHYYEGLYCGWLWYDMARANSIMDEAKKREHENVESY
jgi:hypothetical protein